MEANALAEITKQTKGSMYELSKYCFLLMRLMTITKARNQASQLGCGAVCLNKATSREMNDSALSMLWQNQTGIHRILLSIVLCDQNVK